MLRRLLHDHDEFRGEVIFTFDGDEAGQKAALRAFEGDQNFVCQTYVAVEPDGLDPCDLRSRRATPRCVSWWRGGCRCTGSCSATCVGRYDLDRADGRIDAVREAAKLVASIRDRSKVDAFARELAGMVGRRHRGGAREVRRAAPAPGPAGAAAGARRPGGRSRAARRARAAPRPARPAVLAGAGDPQAGDPAPGGGRPVRRGRRRQRLHPPDLPRGLGVVAAAGGPAAGAADPGWASRLRDTATDPAVSSAISALGVEPLLTAKEPTPRYVAAHVYRLQELTAMRRIAELKSRLQRTNPVEQPTEYNRMFGELVALEQHRAELRELAVGPREAPRPARRRRRRPRGEKVLACAESATGPVVAGTRDALSSIGRAADPLPWEQVESRRLGPDTSRLRVTEVGSWGERAPVHTLTFDEPRPPPRAGPRAGHGQRRAAAARAVSGAPGPPRDRPAGAPRRPPDAWIYEFDEGIDPDDPDVAGRRRGGPGGGPRRGRGRLNGARTDFPGLGRLANLCGRSDPL